MHSSSKYHLINTFHIHVQVQLSTRGGSWIWPRAGPDGVPTDLYWATRFWSYLQAVTPLWVSRISVYIHHYRSANVARMRVEHADWPPGLYADQSACSERKRLRSWTYSDQLVHRLRNI